ncbi:inv protein [Mycobacterium intermedium]|uniref:Inv protein n=1 Tax=Mycobacterium intermedium TaxID=28445 RepID=A0A1E3SMB9_MYCIE|nr:NlpC/P60 family peptidoglycan-binding protein RipD [Mycobacterium intermedium]MCV6966988.1 NlpC/P60 family peptidoglycan-binding protein RipD [Mycobacterium intermedium]ODR03305.1 inv protein [Mycobacterium intermedium]OPE50055.1 inv protein [Mycobacterium intermedium]ORB09686.1 inv protein [Mycobacterium intermedium]
MKRIYAFAVGAAILAAPMVAQPAVAFADPVNRTMDYQQAADIVIQRALSQRGVPFSWAGGGVTGPTRGTGTGANIVGFDASGLVQYAYAGAGLKLPRSSGQMYKVGQRVLPSQARKADLIFYGPEGTQSVALFLGNGQMVEVGDVVQVSPVRTSGMAPYLVRILGAQTTTPAQQTPLQQSPIQQSVPGQTVPGQTVPGQTVPGQTVPGQTVPGQTAVPGQAPAQAAVPGQAPAQAAVPGQAPAQAAIPGQAPAQAAVPGQTVPGQTVPGQTVPGQTVPGQTVPGQTVPGQTVPGQVVPGQTVPGQTVPGQTVPGQTVPGQTVPQAPTYLAPTN